MQSGGQRETARDTPGSSSWGGGTNETVNVLCFDATGAPADSRYVVTFGD